MVVCAKYNAHTEPIFKCLNILKFEDMFKLSVLKFYYRYVHNTLPLYFLNFDFVTQGHIHAHHTRNRSLLRTVRSRTRHTGKCIRYALPHSINTLPASVIDKVNTHSYHGFARYAKTCLLSKYSNECHVENCYICGL